MRGCAICHIEIPTTDMAASKAFYESVFGWAVSVSPDGSYGEWRSPVSGDEEKILGGGLDPGMKPSADAGVVLYLAVEDVEASLAAIEAAGGRRVKPKTKISDEHGWFAHFADPSGNRLGVWSRT